MHLTVTALVTVPPAAAWRVYTTPEFITRWNAASDDWHCPAATLDLRIGGRFCYSMAARDGSVSFDFEGTFTEVTDATRLAYRMDDGRVAGVDFVPEAGGTRVTVVFDAETVHPPEMQQQGWQAILDRYARVAAEAA